MNAAGKGMVLAGLTACLLWVVLGIGNEGNPGDLGRKDFRAFWCGARVWLDGGNPYDATAVQALQKEVGLHGGGPGTFVNPPHALVWLAPWALLDFVPAQRLWLVMNFVVAGVCLVLACRLVPGGRPGVELFWLLAFVPLGLVVYLGQMSLWITLFMLGAVWCRRLERHFLTGFLLWLACIKPQMSFLLVGGFLTEAFFLRRWGVWAGLAAGAAVSLVPWWWSGAPWIPEGFPVEANPLSYYNSSLASQAWVWLDRMGWGTAAICFVFPVLGLIHLGWMQWKALREGRELSWRKLAAISPLYAPYIWSYDFVALALVESAGVRGGWVERWARLGIRAAAWVCLALLPDMGYSFWIAPACAGVIWFLSREVEPKEKSNCGENAAIFPSGPDRV